MSPQQIKWIQFEYNSGQRRPVFLGHADLYIQGAAKKYPPKILWQYFFNDWVILNEILHAYIVLISMQNYYILFNYQ